MHRWKHGAWPVGGVVGAGGAGCDFEDQVADKRCGQRPGKALVPAQEMCDRLKAALDGRIDEQFVIMARTDAHAVEGQQAAIYGAAAYVEAGADMIFAEALNKIEEYQKFTDVIKVQGRETMAEVGKTPLFTTEELADVGVAMTLYPLSAFRAMSAAALNVYETIRKDGSQRAVVDSMQPRTELYDVLGYQAYEDKREALLDQQKTSPREEQGQQEKRRPHCPESRRGRRKDVRWGRGAQAGHRSRRQAAGQFPASFESR